MPALNIILALLVGILLIGDSDSLGAAVEKCRFIERFAFVEDEPFIESAPDDLERCQDALGLAPYVAEPLTQIYLLESKWGDEGIAAGEQLVGAERSFPPKLRAELHARLVNLYQVQGNEEGQSTGR